MKRHVLLASLVAFSSVTQADAQAIGDEAKEALEQAHRSFLDADYRGMNNSLRKALTLSRNEPLYVSNAAQLLKKATELNDGRLPADIDIPEGLSDLKLSQVYRERVEQNPHWIIRLSGDMGLPDFVQQLRIERFPGEVIIDKKAGIGEFDSEKQKDSYYFSAKSNAKETPFQDGLYLFNIHTADGQAKQGWFILSDLSVNTTPSVLAPKPHDSLSSKQPLLRWQEYRSSLLSKYDVRSVFASVSTVQDNGDWDDKWEFYTGEAATTSAQIGHDPRGSGATELAPGKYIAKISYREQHRFGSIRMRREAVAIVPFSIMP